MKKLIGLLLAFCLVLAVTTSALAAKPSITKQPETATTNKKGTVTFSVSVKGSVDTITWYFVNPETGEKTSGKKLNTVFKGIKVQNPNSKKVTLKNVPEDMHGWLVYAHINGNGYKIDSDQVQLLVFGMEPPASAGETPAEEPAEAPAETPAEEPAEQPVEEPVEAPSEEPVEEPVEVPVDEPAEAPVEEPAETPAEQPAEPPVEASDVEILDTMDQEGVDFEAEVQSIVISSNASVMYRLDGTGKQIDDVPSSQLTFDGAANILVSSNEPIASWSVNGIRIQPSEPVKEFKMLNIATSIALDVKFDHASAGNAELDESHMCKVTCTGCAFTYRRAQLISVTEGEVPAGASISVFADSSDLAANGYSINGSEPTNQGLASFKLTVTDDVTISIE